MIKELWENHRLLFLAFLAAVSAMLFFGVQSATHAIYWNDPARKSLDLQPWMTPRYVAQSYHLPRDLLGEALMLEPGAPPRRVRLDVLALEKGVTLEEFQERVNEAVEALQERRAQAREDRGTDGGRPPQGDRQGARQGDE